MADPHARRPPTAAEARALAHPTRLRIVFACRDRAMTNKELAAALGTTPGTVHYHLRPLLEEGFLRAEASRPGPRGSREQPYRSTGKSWELGDDRDGGRALRRVVAEALRDASDDQIVTLARVGATLAPHDLDELVGRLETLAEEFKARSRPDGRSPDDPDPHRVVLLFAVQRESRRDSSS